MIKKILKIFGWSHPSMVDSPGLYLLSSQELEKIVMARNAESLVDTPLVDTLGSESSCSQEKKDVVWFWFFSFWLFKLCFFAGFF